MLDYPVIHNIPYFVPSADQGEPALLKIIKVVSSPLPKGADKFDIDMRDNDPFDIVVGELDPEAATRLTPYWRFARQAGMPSSSSKPSKRLPANTWLLRQQPVFRH